MRFFRIHKEGKTPVIKTAIILTLINVVFILLFPGIKFIFVLAALSLLLFAMTLNFFRHPDRTYKGDLHGLVNSPTDGTVVVIEKVFENEFFHDERIQVSIFMSFFNAHSNWVPVTGKITHLSHVPGNFHAAFLPKSSHENEHTNILIETPEYGTILTKQIAGAVARRIVTYVKQDEQVHIGAPLGFIKLGSRMDIFLPLDSEILVEMDEEVRANITFLARLNKLPKK